MPTQSDQSTLRRTDFVIFPKQLLRDTKDRKGTLFVYAWLWDYAGSGDNACPAVETQSLECGMKEEAVREARRWLEAEGWVTREKRPGYTDIFHVRTEPALFGRTLMNTGKVVGSGTEPLPQAGDTPKGGPPKRGGTPLPLSGEYTPPPKGGDEQEVLNKKKTEQPLEPPVSPTALRAPGDEPIEVEPVEVKAIAIEVEPLVEPLESLEPRELTGPTGPNSLQPVAAATIEISAQAIAAPAAAGKTKAQKAAAATAKAFPLPGDAPDLAPEVLELLASWWQRRCRAHPRADRLQLGKRSLCAIDLALENGVLAPYLEQAAEAGWQSLGHEGHRRVIAGLLEAAETSEFPLALAHSESRMLRFGKPHFDARDLRQQKRDAMNAGIHAEVRRAHDDQC
jgi:hypothetical protein